MALFTVVKYVLGFAFAFLLYNIIGNITYQTRYENDSWDDLPVSWVAFGDQMYGIWLLFSIIAAAVIVLAAIVEAKRGRAIQT